MSYFCILMYRRLVNFSELDDCMPSLAPASAVSVYPCSEVSLLDLDEHMPSSGDLDEHMPSSGDLDEHMSSSGL